MKYKVIFYLTIISCVCACLVVFPSSSTEGVKAGLRLCYATIIPSLYPFTVCSLMLFEYKNILTSNPKGNKILKSLTGLNSQILYLFLISCIGGYPVGAMLIEDEFKQKHISKRDGERLLSFCVNSAPSFTIIAVGSIYLNSFTLGVVLYFSSVLAALIIAFIMSRNIVYTGSSQNKNIASQRFSDAFVQKTYDAINSMIGICAFIVLFSAFIGLLESIIKNTKVFCTISSLLEVSNGIFYSDKNIYTIAFLLGFSGVCVHFQVLSMCKELRPNYVKFLAVRILHGILTAVLTYIGVKSFKISVPTISQDNNFTIQISEYSIFFSLLLILTAVCFILSVQFSLKRQ